MNKDRNHPWLRPLWRRVALVAFCAVWSAFEFADGSTTWGTLTGAMALYGAWTFLVKHDASALPDAPPPDPSSPDTSLKD